MVRCSSIQIVTFALSVFLQMVAFVSWSMRMRVELRRRPLSQTPPVPPVLQLVLLVPQAIRSSLARFLRYAAPGLNVLAYNEVPQGKQLKLVGSVGA